MKVLIATAALLFPLTLFAHSGGTDSYGCHNQTSTKTYHCHSGKLSGQSFSSKDAMLVVLNTSTPTTPTEPSTPATPTETLPVTVTYNRDDYLTSWADADGDCQDARQEVLIAESLLPVVLSSNGCSVVSGFWLDPYTNQTFTNPSDLDIDHLVPLKEAHDSGAWAWSSSAKRAYANNIANPLVLIAVDDSTNQSKGDRDPAEWLPPNLAYRCEYIKSWISVKEAYGLTMDSAEEIAISQILDLNLLSATARTRPGVALTNSGQLASQSAFAVSMTSPQSCGYLSKTSPSSPIALTGSITPDPQHIGQVVDVIAVAVLGDVIVMKTHDGNFLPWNVELQTLIPAIEDVTLTGPIDFDIISGTLGLHGVLHLFIGYVTASGHLIYSPEPASFEFVSP